MEREHIVEQALIAANNLITALQQGTTLDLVNLEKWNESLARFVIFTRQQHHIQRELLSIVSQVFQLTYTLTDEHRASAIQLLQQYVVALQHAVSTLDDLGQSVKWEPPVREDGGPLWSQS